MTWPGWLCRLVPYLGRRQAEADVEEELRLHLELERERQREGGVPEGDDLRAARRTLGNATLIRERTRDVWSWRWLDELARDIRHAGRGLRRSPGFAAVVVIILALGNGASTATFSIVHGMLLRPLPYPNPERIVSVRGLTNVSFPTLRDDTRTFEHLAAYSAPRRFIWKRPAGTLALRGWEVSPSFFSGVYEVAPHLGRFFREDEAVAGAHRVVVLSFHAWRDRFGSDPGVIGTPLDLDGASYTVVGVLPRGFTAPTGGMEVWTPLLVAPYEQTDGTTTFTMTYPIDALGRLRTSVFALAGGDGARALLSDWERDYNFVRPYEVIFHNMACARVRSDERAGNRGQLNRERGHAAEEKKRRREPDAGRSATARACEHENGTPATPQRTPAAFANDRRARAGRSTTSRSKPAAGRTPSRIPASGPLRAK